jgi:hypothetical protein
MSAEGRYICMNTDVTPPLSELSREASLLAASRNGVEAFCAELVRSFDPPLRIDARALAEALSGLNAPEREQVAALCAEGLSRAYHDSAQDPQRLSTALASFAQLGRYMVDEPGLFGTALSPSGVVSAKLAAGVGELAVTVFTKEVVDGALPENTLENWQFAAQEIARFSRALKSWVDAQGGLDLAAPAAGQDLRREARVLVA